MNTASFVAYDDTGQIIQGFQVNPRWEKANKKAMRDAGYSVIDGYGTPQTHYVKNGEILKRPQPTLSSESVKAFEGEVLITDAPIGGTLCIDENEYRIDESPIRIEAGEPATFTIRIPEYFPYRRLITTEIKVYES